MPEIKSTEILECPVVIAEDIIEKIFNCDVSVEVPASFIHESFIKAKKVDCTVINNNLILNCDIHIKVLYSCGDNLIYSAVSEKEAVYCINVPGAKQGMGAVIDTEVEHLSSRLLKKGAVIHHGIILKLFMKLYEKKNMLLRTGSGPLVKVKRVVGEKQCRKIVKAIIQLKKRPCKINNIKIDILKLKSDVVKDRVIINGILKETLIFTEEDGSRGKQFEEIHFDEYINIFGVDRGMSAELKAELEAVHEKEDDNGKFIKQEVVFNIKLKVMETVKTCLKTGSDVLVMLPEVIGENNQYYFQKEVMELKNNPVKINSLQANVEIMDLKSLKNKVIIQGSINRKCIYIGENYIVYNQHQKKSFSILAVIDGVQPGMNAEVETELVYQKEELNKDLLASEVLLQLFVTVTENIQFKITEAEEKLEQDVIRAPQGFMG